jgi:hypothetical protein
MGIRYPKDYKLVELSITSPIQNLDLKNILVELSYHEDIFSSTVSGYLMVGDSQSFLEALNINGNEFLTIRFSKIDESDEIYKNLRVYKVAKRQLEGSQYTESYCLYFCSEELLLNEQIKICKAYPQQIISDNVNDILLNKLKVPSSKISMVETTTGLYDFIVPTIKPFDAINWMANYARPASGNPGADFFFFENKFGFNFTSLQTLFNGSPYSYYAYNPKNVDPTDLNGEVYTVSTYEILDSFDTLRGVTTGTFANKLLSVDILSRRVKTTTFDYMNYQNEAVSLNGAPITNLYKNRFGKTQNKTADAVYKLVYSNFNQKVVPYIESTSEEYGTIASDIHAETYIPHRTSQLNLVNYHRVKISVPGDPGLTVGAVINFSLLSINPNQKAPDQFYSGNYLVTAVRHIINTNEYITVLEIAKESTPTEYAALNNSSTGMQGLVKGLFD